MPLHVTQSLLLGISKMHRYMKWYTGMYVIYISPTKTVH